MTDSPTLADLRLVETWTDRCPNGWDCRAKCACHQLPPEAMEADLAQHYEAPGQTRPVTLSDLVSVLEDLGAEKVEVSLIDLEVDGETVQVGTPIMRAPGTYLVYRVEEDCG